jgi:hypothetical protein
VDRQRQILNDVYGKPRPGMGVPSSGQQQQANGGYGNGYNNQNNNGYRRNYGNPRYM